MPKKFHKIPILAALGLGTLGAIAPAFAAYDPTAVYTVADAAAYHVLYAAEMKETCGEYVDSQEYRNCHVVVESKYRKADPGTYATMYAVNRSSKNTIVSAYNPNAGTMRFYIDYDRMFDDEPTEFQNFVIFWVDKSYIYRGQLESMSREYNAWNIANPILNGKEAPEGIHVMYKSAQGEENWFTSGVEQRVVLDDEANFLTDGHLGSIYLMGYKTNGEKHYTANSFGGACKDLAADQECRTSFFYDADRGSADGGFRVWDATAEDLALIERKAIIKEAKAAAKEAEERAIAAEAAAKDAEERAKAAEERAIAAEEKAAAAEARAKTAESAAATARTTATAAKTAAETAKANAATAQANAAAAQATAEAATASAREAEFAAQAAEMTAREAEANAIAAETAAREAEAVARAAEERASQLAIEAQKATEEANKIAEEARKAAEEASKLATEARQTATEASQVAEETRTMAAEFAKVAEELNARIEEINITTAELRELLASTPVSSSVTNTYNTYNSTYVTRVLNSVDSSTEEAEAPAITAQTTSGETAAVSETVTSSEDTVEVPLAAAPEEKQFPWWIIAFALTGIALVLWWLIPARKKI